MGRSWEVRRLVLARILLPVAFEHLAWASGLVVALAIAAVQAWVVLTLVSACMRIWSLGHLGRGSMSLKLDGTACFSS